MSLRTGDRYLIRELNTSIVLDCIRRESPVARTDIARMTGISRSTVTSIISFLMEKELVEEIGAGESTGGRRPVMLAFKPNRYGAIGLKVQPDRVIGCMTDLDGTIIRRTQRPLAGKSIHHVLHAMDAAIDNLTLDWNKDFVIGVGVALPGLVDSTDGLSVRPHFFDWRDFPLQERLEARWELPVMVENDARAGSLGEKWVRPDDEDTFLFVTVGVGIGAGLVVNGEIMEGDLVGAGHLGHMMVNHEADMPCHCGLYGCLETVANEAALIRYFQETRGLLSSDNGSMMTATEIFRRAAEADRASVYAIDRVASYLGMAIANVIKLFGVRRVVIGGEMGVAGGAHLVEALTGHIRRHVFPEIRDGVVVMQSVLGNDVWQVGAASLALALLFRPPVYDHRPSVLDRVSITQEFV